MYYTLEQYLDSVITKTPLQAPSGLDLNFGYMGGRGMRDLSSKTPEEQVALFRSVPKSATDVDMRFFNFYTSVMDNLSKAGVSFPNVKTLLVIEHDLQTLHGAKPDKVAALHTVFPNVNNLVLYDRQSGRKKFATPGEPGRIAISLGFKAQAPSLKKMAFSNVNIEISTKIEGLLASECEAYKEANDGQDMPYEVEESRRTGLILATINDLKVPESLKKELVEQHFSETIKKIASEVDDLMEGERFEYQEANNGQDMPVKEQRGRQRQLMIIVIKGSDIDEGLKSQFLKYMKEENPAPPGP